MNYEINDDTLAIIPIDEYSSKVYEIDEEYIVDETPYSIMENSCRYFGSSLEGRIMGSKDVLGAIYKIPVIVEESQKLIFFPTKALDSPTVSWISYKNIKSIEKYNDKSLVKFKNDEKVILDCPYFSLKNQIFRCNMLDNIFYNRKGLKKDD